VILEDRSEGTVVVDQATGKMVMDVVRRG